MGRTCFEILDVGLILGGACARARKMQICRHGCALALLVFRNRKLKYYKYDESYFSMRLSITIPDGLAKALDHLLATREYRKKSHVIADALEEFLKIHHPDLLEVEQKTYPTVLWKLKKARGARGPSPRVFGRKPIGEWEIVKLR